MILVPELCVNIISSFSYRLFPSVHEIFTKWYTYQPYNYYVDDN
jgi:hypothetical protein